MAELITYDFSKNGALGTASDLSACYVALRRNHDSADQQALIRSLRDGGCKSICYWSSSGSSLCDAEQKTILGEFLDSLAGDVRDKQRVALVCDDVPLLHLAMAFAQ